MPREGAFGNLPSTTLDNISGSCWNSFSFVGENTVSDRIERGLRPTPSPFFLAGETCRRGEQRRAQSCLAKWNA